MMDFMKYTTAMVGGDVAGTEVMKEEETAAAVADTEEAREDTGEGVGSVVTEVRPVDAVVAVVDMVVVVAVVVNLHDRPRNAPDDS